MRLVSILAAGLAPFTLAACAEPAVDPAGEPAMASAPPAGDAEAAGAVAETLNLAVQEITMADMGMAALEGEHACSFAPVPGGEALFLARADMGDEASGQGVVKLPPGIRALEMDGAGGFAAMRGGARFSGGNIRVTITPTGEERPRPERRAGEERQAAAPQASEEPPARPATMVIGSGGNEISIRGVYECGS